MTNTKELRDKISKELDDFFKEPKNFLDIIVEDGKEACSFDITIKRKEAAELNSKIKERVLSVIKD